ncbi:hypothetical protein TGMAS_205590B, partial [Toxoplasma gondii MAS]
KLDEVIEKMGREQLLIQQQHRQRIDEVERSTRAEASAQLKSASEENAKLVETLKLKDFEAAAAEKRLAALEVINTEKQQRILEYEAELEERRKQNQALLEEKEEEAQKWKSVIQDREAVGIEERGTVLIKRPRCFRFRRAEWSMHRPALRKTLTPRASFN